MKQNLRIDFLLALVGRETARTDAAGNTTAIQYDPSTASPSCVTDALGNTACYAYDPRGRKTAEYGTALQPSVFGYDDADRLVSLMTFRVPGETIAADPRERQLSRMQSLVLSF